VGWERAYAACMPFRIEYLRNGKVIASATYDGSRQGVGRVTADGMVRHYALAARILDLESAEFIYLMEASQVAKRTSRPETPRQSGH
jgi:hypothetical protein